MARAATSLKLDPELKQRIDRLAEAQQRTAHWLMKRAIEEYVHREEEHETLSRELEERRRRYEETGLHLDGAEVDEWIAARLRGEAPARPKPHR